MVVGKTSTDGDDELWFGQLRLLFKCGEHLLALVRYYDKRAAQGDFLATRPYERFRWQRLQWEQVKSAGRQGAQPSYMLVHLRSIIGRVYVVRDYKAQREAEVDWKDEWFYVCRHKWWREPLDTRTLKSVHGAAFHEGKFIVHEAQKAAEGADGV